MAQLKGIIVPIITPMKEDETINEQELRNQVNRMIENGIHGIFPFGTNGEGYILNEKKKEQVLSIVIDEVKGRVPVYATVIRRPGKGTFVIPRDQKLENGNPLLGGGRIVSVYPDFFSYSDWEMTHRIELAALKNNCELVSLKLQPDSDLESLFELLEREEGIDGAIIRIGFNLTGTLVKRLVAVGFPMVRRLAPPGASG